MYGFNNKRNTEPWLGESWVDQDKLVVICESVFDLAAIYPVYPNVMCSLSSGMAANKVKRIADAGEIVTLYDHGKGGDSARKTLHKYLGKAILGDCIPTKEQDDAGNMSIEEIAEILKDYI